MADELAPSPPAPTPQQQPAAPPPVSPYVPAVNPGMVMLPKADHEHLLTQLSELTKFKEGEAERLKKVDADRLQAIADKQGVEAALKAARDAEAQKIAERDQRIRDLETRHLTANKQRVLRDLMQGTQWTTDEAFVAARERMESMFDVRESADGSIVVFEKGTLRPADSAVPDLLKGPKFDFLQAPKAQGGAGAGNSMRSPAPDPGFVAPANEGQAIYAAWLASNAAAAEAGYSGIGFKMPGQGQGPGYSPVQNGPPAFPPAGRPGFAGQSRN